MPPLFADVGSPATQGAKVRKLALRESSDVDKDVERSDHGGPFFLAFDGHTSIRDLRCVKRSGKWDSLPRGTMATASLQKEGTFPESLSSE